MNPTVVLGIISVSVSIGVVLGAFLSAVRQVRIERRNRV